MENQMRLWLAAAILAASAGNALGHGDKPHPSKGVDYSNAKQTPFGRAADPETAKRTVRVEMTDEMRFKPAEITVGRGEVVRFVPVNKGQVMHEMVLGTMPELKRHAEMMKKHPGMEHDAPHMAHVAPGKQGVMGWQFTSAGEFFYGCLSPATSKRGWSAR
jgi:uncharacterized cupredoxin-like copper-binding protein